MIKPFKKAKERIMIKTFKKEVRETIEVVKKELEERKAGIQGQGTEEELTDVLSELAQTIDIVDEIEYLEKYPRPLYCARFAVDEWEWDERNPSEVFERLMYLEKEYAKIWASQKDMGYRPYGGIIEERSGCKIIPFHRYKGEKEKEKEQEETEETAKINEEDISNITTEQK